MDRAKVELRTRPDFARPQKSGTGAAAQLHDVARLREPEKIFPVFLAQRLAEPRLLLHELLPEILVVGDQLERRGQAKIMAVVREQLHAKGVDRSEKGAVERAHNFRRKFIFEDLLAGALLHLVRGAIREGDDDELRQNFARIWRACDLQNAIGDRAGLARAGRGHDREIAIEFFHESTPFRLIARRFHQ